MTKIKGNEREESGKRRVDKAGKERGKEGRMNK